MLREQGLQIKIKSRMDEGNGILKIFGHWKMQQWIGRNGNDSGQNPLDQSEIVKSEIGLQVRHAFSGGIPGRERVLGLGVSGRVTMLLAGMDIF